jgi:bifunctional DNase/RNase
MVEDLGGAVVRVAITELVDTTYFATIVLDINGMPYELDARPSDAVALAIRADVPILVDPEVLDQAGFEPDQDGEGRISPDEGEIVPEEKLGVFREFINELDLDDLGKT